MLVVFPYTFLKDYNNILYRIIIYYLINRPMGFPTAAALKMGCGFPLHSNPEEHVGKVLSTSRQGK